MPPAASLRISMYLPKGRGSFSSLAEAGEASPAGFTMPPSAPAPATPKAPSRSCRVWRGSGPRSLIRRAPSSILAPAASQAKLRDTTQDGEPALVEPCSPSRRALAPRGARRRRRSLERRGGVGSWRGQHWAMWVGLGLLSMACAGAGCGGASADLTRAREAYDHGDLYRTLGALAHRGRKRSLAVARGASAARLPTRHDRPPHRGHALRRSRRGER
jgi:hypothetical protein